MTCKSSVSVSHQKKSSLLRAIHVDLQVLTATFMLSAGFLTTNNGDNKDYMVAIKYVAKAAAACFLA